MWRLPALLLAVSVVACGAHRGFIYDHAGEPRYFGEVTDGALRACADQSEHCRLRVVSFNIKFAEKLGQALDVLRQSPLACADVIVLQEMNLAGTEAIACSLGMGFIYYPAAIHPSGNRQFGVALLSPWPIVEDEKVVLPCLSEGDAALKVSPVATVRVRGVPVRFANVHLQTKLSGGERRAQLETVLARISPTPRPTVIAGDFNTGDRNLLQSAV